MAQTRPNGEQLLSLNKEFNKSLTTFMYAFSYPFIPQSGLGRLYPVEISYSQGIKMDIIRDQHGFCLHVHDGFITLPGTLLAK